ncbi:GC-rich sequence DNA-binding factor [Cynara cardunculus var. scolymus]|uniref:GC-rich sequence DNA-binding factor n=1 Tax=Cynara cardunculus var. scolymus TaxID=59895 RepID=A0A103XV85_CYNCS|nr:GC-rich sequence DNA-binding factor [Cynara cardunculus var. scolymus]
MSSRVRNFRRRAEEDDNDDEEKEKMATPATTKKYQSKPATTTLKPKKPSLLSFADDESTDTTTPVPRNRPSNPNKQPSSSRLSKPSSLSSLSSHKLISAKDRNSAKERTSSASSLPSNVQPQAGVYTKEALLELQKNTKTLGSSTSRPRPPPSEPIIVLKGMVKPVIDDSSRNTKEEDEESGRDETMNRLGSIGLGVKVGKGGNLDGGVIPDQAMIDAIRAKRERLRQSRAAAPDYISLDGGSNHGEAEGLSDEEPEFQGRIALIGERSQGKKGVFEDVLVDVSKTTVRKESEVIASDDGVEDEEDEEDKMWEEEQFRKGLGKRMDEGVVVRGASSSNVPTTVQNVQQKVVYPTVPVSTYPSINGGPTIGGSLGWSLGSDTMSISQQDALSKKALDESVRRLKVCIYVSEAKLHLELHIIRLGGKFGATEDCGPSSSETYGRTLTSLTKTDENLSDSLMKVTALENALTAAGEKFIFMQKLRDYVSVICDFLQKLFLYIVLMSLLFSTDVWSISYNAKADMIFFFQIQDKAPFIEELEYQMQKLHKVRAEANLERRAADGDDELVEIEASVNAAMAVFNKGGSTSSMVEAASSAAQAALTALRESRNLPVKLDELGRDVNLQKRLDMKRRAESRQRRKAQSESKRMSSMETDSLHRTVEGESSTDESDGESTAYESNRDQLLQIAGQIFSDAAEEFSQLSAVKEKFEMWKKDYSSSYKDAYMSLSIPAIFSPYVRLELLKWDPLHEDSDFIDMQWHELLFNYGLPEDESQINSDDADVNLVPDLVEKVAIPILQHEIAHCWDMLSTKETKCAVAATNLVFRYVPHSSKSVPTWNTLVLKAVPNAARFAAYRFGMSVRLMRNICLWNNVLSTSILEKLALDELLSGKILPHLRSIQSNIHDAITRTERIVASMSGMWTGPGVTGERSLRLQPMVDYLLVLGRILEKRQSSSGTNGLARRLKKMLVELNEYDHARQVSRTFNLKEAL